MTNSSMTNPSKWTKYHSYIHLAILVAIIALGFFISNFTRLGSWAITLVLMIGYVFVAGHGVTGSIKGALVDDRYKISLSRLQAILWTILILSAILTASLYNISKGEKDALAIVIPQELWLAMGISLTSLIGSPLIRNNKKGKNAKPETWARTRDVMSRQGENTAQIRPEGVILMNNNPSNAQWADLFKGEEVGDGALLDLSKIQMFFFTVILVLAYTFAIGYLMNGSGSVHELPALSQSQVALLGISHAGYLVNKAMPHTEV